MFFIELIGKCEAFLTQMLQFGTAFADQAVFIRRQGGVNIHTSSVHENDEIAMIRILPDLRLRLVKQGTLLRYLPRRMRYVSLGLIATSVAVLWSGMALARQPSAPLKLASPALVLGDSVEAGMSWEEEVRLGKKAFIEFRQQGVWLEDPEVDAYLQSLVERLRTREGVWASRRMRIKAVDDPAINAFALPGGFMGMNVGLLRRVESESELAAVLAHELSHVSQRHVVRMMESQPNQLLWLLGGVLIAAGAAAGGSGQGAEAAIAATQAATMQQQIHFTQSFEREADAIGLGLLQSLKDRPFDPAAMITMLQGLQKQVHGIQLPPYLRTHPIESERMALLEDRLKAVPYRQYVDSFDFLLVKALVSSYKDLSAEAVARHKKLYDAKQYVDERAARYAWAAALLRADRYAEAETVIEPLYKKLSHPMIASLYGLVLTKQNKYELAREVYHRALQKWADSEQLMFDYASLLKLSGQPESALAFLERALVRSPEFTQAFKLASECAAALGRRSDQFRYEAQYLGYHQGLWRPALERADWALEAASTWQEQSIIQAMKKKMEKEAKEQ